jgi:hypothetical protein
MKRVLSAVYLLLLLLPSSGLPQGFSYTHYDVRDGLAGSTAYCITQDREGCIWTGTETGVSRFHGTHFRNFTTVDGLPDVEILQMFADSRDRIWMAPFSKSICYYFSGKIHNQQNDAILRSIHVQGLIEHFAEDEAGNVLVQEPSRLHLISSGGSVTEIDSVNGRPLANCHDESVSDDGHFLVQIGDTIYHFASGVFSSIMTVQFPEEPKSPSYIRLTRNWLVYRTAYGQSCIHSFRSGRSSLVPFNYHNYRHVNFNILDDSLVFVDESSGATEYNARTLDRKQFLPGIEVSGVFRDAGHNLWFATIGKGLFRLNSDEIKVIRLSSPYCDNCGVFSILKIDDTLLVGSARNSVFRYSLPDMRPVSWTQLNPEEKKRVMGIIRLKDGRVVYGTDFSLSTYAGRAPLPDYYHSMAVKGMFRRPDEKILVASWSGAFLLDLDRKTRHIDRVWRERTTAIFYSHDTTYIGTLNGLIAILPNGRSTLMGQDIGSLKARVSAMAGGSDGTLWVAPYNGEGVVGIRAGKLIRRIGMAEGLTSNVCRTIALQGDILWIGTDKGLNRVDLARPDSPVVRYTANDGLPSDVINVIYPIGTTIYVGTSEGFAYFDETKGIASDECRLNLVGVTSAGRNRMTDTGRLRLPANENNIRFDFVGISYRSAGKITYRYRLIGLDSLWKETQDNYLTYPTLPSGNYQLELVAVNRYGVTSTHRFIPFVVAAPFWNQIWFNALELFVFIFGTWVFAAWRIRRVRRLQELRAMQSRRMAELEHIALQSQMNPHFIFNCLNSIQQFVFDKDMLATNEYITGFARLIRATLNHSSRPLISFAEEVEYLTDYLSLEKMRFKNKMVFFIEVDPAIDVHHRLLPPMLLQPYVENAVRHGLRHKMLGQGYIRIHIRPEAEKTVVTIRDNGIGRKRAIEYQTGEHIEYQSRGMSLTAARIQIIEVLYQTEIEVQVEDLKDDRGLADGTLILIRFPAFFDHSGRDS